MGRINLEPSQAPACKHWSPHSVPIRVRVRVRVEWSQSCIFRFSHGGRRQCLPVYWYSNTAVIHMLLNIENFLEDRFALNNENTSAFRRNRFVRHPPARSRCLCKPRRPSCVGRAFARGVLLGGSSEHSIWALELSSLQPTPEYTYVMHARSRNQ